MIDADRALARLQAGNKRFMSGDQNLETINDLRKRSQLVAGQQPFAAILGCSDSRVPVELIFDQGLGDLFVIRVAGNIVASTQIGSIEFAAEQFKTQLVVVLGHSHCGAVHATLDQLRRPAAMQSVHLKRIVDHISPSVKHLVAETTELTEECVDRAVRANVRHVCRQLQHGSEVIEQRIHSGLLKVVGAVYSIDSGRVDFLRDESIQSTAGD